jgi:hypothetical protein
MMAVMTAATASRAAMRQHGEPCPPRLVSSAASVSATLAPVPLPTTRYAEPLAWRRAAKAPVHDGCPSSMFAQR